METMKPVDGRHLSGSIAAALALCAHSAMSFSPPDLEDLALWLDASVAESIEIESGSVAAWNDARGGVAGGFQDSEAARPAIATENDLPAVVFTGTAWLDTTYEYLSRSDTRASVFVVAKSTAPEQTGFLLHSDGSQSTRSRQGFSIVWIDGAGDVVLGGGLNAFEDTPDGDNIIGASWDNSAGEGLTLANGWMQPASVNGAYTSNRLQIGARSSGDIPWTGHLRELLVFERDLTPDNCRRVEGYLAHKWDLAGNLPEEHPYKEAPPQGVLFTKTTPFQIADPTTGSTAFTGSNKVTLLDFPIPEGYDHYQLTFGQNDPAGIVPEDWQFTNSLPTVLTFERPALNADISFHAWFTNTSAEVTLKRATGSIRYTTTAPVASAKNNASVYRFPGWSYARIHAGEVDDGSLGGTDNGADIGIYRQWLTIVSGPDPDGTQQGAWLSVRSTGTYQCRLHVMNNAGLVTASDSFTLTVTDYQPPPLVLQAGETVTFDTSTGTYQGAVTGNGIVSNSVFRETFPNSLAAFYFSKIEIKSGAVVILAGTNAISLHSDTYIHLDAELDGRGNFGAGDSDRRVGPPGKLGGFRGGDGARATDVIPAEDVDYDGGGPGGALKDVSGSAHGGNGGGFGGLGGRGNNSDAGLYLGQMYNDAVLSEGLIGGSGGARGSFRCGGAGGGAIRLVARGRLSVGNNGGIDVSGGRGGNETRAGGGGSGGAVWLKGYSIVLSSGATVLANGGHGGNGERGGGGGAGGRILLEASLLEVDGLFVTEGLQENGPVIHAAGGPGGIHSSRPGLAGADGTIYYLYHVPAGTVLLLR